MLEIKRKKKSRAINYHTQLVWALFEMRDSGGFPVFPFRLSFSVPLTFPHSVCARDHIAPFSFFMITLILISSFFHSLDRNLFFPHALLLTYRSDYIDSAFTPPKIDKRWEWDEKKKEVVCVGNEGIYTEQGVKNKCERAVVLEGCSLGAWSNWGSRPTGGYCDVSDLKAEQQWT